MGSTESPFWFCRLTTSNEVDFEFGFKPYEPQWMSFVKEVSKTEKPHYHLLVEWKEPITRNEMTRRIKHFFPANGNAALSVKVWDGLPRAFQYMHKQHIPTVIGTKEGFTDTDTFVKMARSLDGFVKRQSKPSYDKVVQGTIEYIKDTKLQFKEGDDDYVKKYVADIYLKQLRVHNLPAKNIFAMRGDCVKIMFSLDLTRMNDVLASSISRGI